MDPEKFMLGREPGLQLELAGVIPRYSAGATINLPLRGVASIECKVLLQRDQWPVIAKMFGPSHVSEFYLEGGVLSRLWQTITGNLRVRCRVLPTRPATDNQQPTKDN